MDRQIPASTHDLLQFFAEALEQIGNGVILFDDRNHIRYFNRAMEAISGWPREQVIGHNLGVLAPPTMRERYDTTLHPGTGNRIHELAATPQDIKLIRRDGSHCWIRASLSKLGDGDEGLHMALIQDVTLQRQQQERERLLSLGFDETRSAVLICDGRGHIVQLNKGFRCLFGFADEEAIGSYVPALLAPDGYSPAQADTYIERLKDGHSIQSDERLRRKDGQPLWCSVNTNPIFDSYGVMVNTVVVLMDITRTKMHEVLQYKMLDAMVREVPTAEVFRMMCLEVERIAPQVIGSVLRLEDGRLHTLAAPSLPDAYSRLVDGMAIGPATGSCGTSAYTGSTVISRDIATDPYWEGLAAQALEHGLAACWSTPIKASDGRVLGTFAFYYRQPHDPDEFHHQLVDVIVHLCALALEREEARNHIRRLAFYDDLTGLPNRSLLHAQADRAINAAGHSGDSLALLFIDLDRFKRVNDMLGHPGGDELLRIVAQRLQAETGPMDIVGRLSGDEFVVVLTPCDQDSAHERGTRLLQALSQPWRWGEVQTHTSASIGISLFPHDGHDMESLLQHADMAMYQAKRGGRARVRFYSHEMNRSAQERRALESALRQALEQGQLQLYYQPQVDLASGRLHGVEALARWHHPELGSVPPIRFIPLAEECGLIDGIGQWALETACRQLAAWRRQGMDVPSVAVNLSATNFHDPGLPARIARILQQEAVAASGLTLEITEEMLLNDDPNTLRTLREVHALGVRLAVDDFGTGYSSLSYLRQLPISGLKLDRSFVHDIERNTIASALTQAIAHIGQSLQLEVVAEGVENTGQLQLLLQQGYRVVQGFHFTPPLPAAALQRWLDTQLPAIVRSSADTGA